MDVLGFFFCTVRIALRVSPTTALGCQGIRLPTKKNLLCLQDITGAPGRAWLFSLCKDPERPEWGYTGQYVRKWAHVSLCFPLDRVDRWPQAALNSKNVQWLTHFVPLQLSQGGINCGNVSPHGSLESTITAPACLLCLPIWPGMRFGHIQYVVQALYEHFCDDSPSVTTAMHLFVPTAYNATCKVRLLLLRGGLICLLTM
jgi:hypothetical protein